MKHARAYVDEAVDRLSHEEVLILWAALAMNEDPRDKQGYDKVSHLYTEEDGRRMSAETQERFCILASERFHKPRKWNPAGRITRQFWEDK